MKKIILSIFLLFAFLVMMNAQVGIEGKSPSKSAILDFPNDATKGILLPRVENKSYSWNFCL